MITAMSSMVSSMSTVFLGFSAVASVVVVITLIVLLTTRELANTINSGISLRIAKVAIIGILPLIMAFTVIVFVAIAEIL